MIRQRALVVCCAVAALLGAGACSKSDTASSGPVSTTAPRAIVGQVSTVSTAPRTNGSGPTEGEGGPSPLDSIWAFRSEHMVTCEAPSTPVRIVVGVSTGSEVPLRLTLDDKVVDLADIERELGADLPCDGKPHQLQLVIGEGTSAVTMTHVLPTAVIAPPDKDPGVPRLTEFGLDHEVRRCPWPEPTKVDYGFEHTTRAKAELDGTAVPGIQVTDRGQVQLDVLCSGGPVRVLTFELANDVLTYRFNDTLIRVPA